MLNSSKSPVADEVTKRTVYISNLSYKRDRHGLKSLFSHYGDVCNIKIIVEPTTNQSRGMAFVEMKTIAQAKAAIEGLNLHIIDGRTAKATWATPQRSITKRFASTPGEKKDPNRDLKFKDIQLMKKERNEQRRKSAKPPGFV
jgi:RNA recognition motif-containing protein